MIGLYVTVPVACFRKGMAREYLETEIIPPPSTCYGFLLSLVGETQRSAHIGARVSAAIRGAPAISTVLRTMWRVKDRKLGSGQGNNARPDYQELLTNLELLIWLDSGDETGLPAAINLEGKVIGAMKSKGAGVKRFGGLSLGESTHLVDQITVLPNAMVPQDGWTLFSSNARGCLSLPVWVDHVGSKGTRHVVGDLSPAGLTPPERLALPQIQPLNSAG
jgi:CRISPR-associated protein Cas5t